MSQLCNILRSSFFVAQDVRERILVVCAMWRVNEIYVMRRARCCSSSFLQLISLSLRRRCMAMCGFNLQFSQHARFITCWGFSAKKKNFFNFTCVWAHPLPPVAGVFERWWFDKVDDTRTRLMKKRWKSKPGAEWLASTRHLSCRAICRCMRFVMLNANAFRSRT